MATILSAMGDVVKAQVDAAVIATKDEKPVPPGTFLFRTFDFETKDCPWKIGEQGGVQSVLEDVDPAFVLCGDGTIVRRLDYGAGSALVGPFRFSAKVRLAQSGKASVLFDLDLATPPTVLA